MGAASLTGHALLLASSSPDIRMRRLPWFLLCSTLALFVAVPSLADEAAVTHLVKIDQTTGSGAEAGTGDEVEVHYVGWLYDDKAPDHHGAKVDSSYDRGQPISFTLGDTGMIAGWNQGIVGMRVGGKRTLLVPPQLGYRGRRVGAVPPHSTLVFDIELLAVHH